LLGDDLLDPTARDLAVQRRRQQMALALELGALAERPGPPAPEVRVDAALGATELQGGVVVLAFPLPDPDDDAAAQQRQRSGVAVSHRALDEPDAAAFGLGEADAECLAAAFHHLGPERHLDLHSIDPGWNRARTVGRHGTVVAQRRPAGNPQSWRFIPCRTRRYRRALTCWLVKSESHPHRRISDTSRMPASDWMAPEGVKSLDSGLVGKPPFGGAAALDSICSLCSMRVSRWSRTEMVKGLPALGLGCFFS
jgi:hypothetical protein